MLQNNSTLKSLIDKLWQNFCEGGIANPLTAIEQITYLIFMKRLDDLETKRERDADFTGEKYTSRFTGLYKIPGSDQTIDKNELRWSVFKHKPADEMLLHVQMRVFPFLKTIQTTPTPGEVGRELLPSGRLGWGGAFHQTHGKRCVYYAKSQFARFGH